MFVSTRKSVRVPLTVLLTLGFLAWFLAQWMPLWLAMIASGILFGLAHAYQGLGGILKTGAIGIAFGGLTLLAQSIVPAILLHIAVDALNGQLAYVVITTPRPVVVDPEDDWLTPDPEDESGG